MESLFSSIAVNAVSEPRRSAARLGRTSQSLIAMFFGSEKYVVEFVRQNTAHRFA